MGNSTYQFDYFSVRETEAFRYYQLPQIFFEDERFKKKSGCKFSTDAKVLYSMLLNRVSLSKKNKWFDKRGRVYVICTNKEVQNLLDCADQKATKSLKELETIGLIRREGTMKADRIYVMNFTTLPLLPLDPKDEPQNNLDTEQLQNYDVENFSNDTHLGVDFDGKKVFHSDLSHDNELSAKSWKSRCSNPDLNNPDSSNPNLINPSDLSAEQQIEIDRLMDGIKAQIDYDILLHNNPHDENRLNEIVSIILSVLISKEEFLFVGSAKTLKTLVHQNFLKLRHEHVEYVFECLKNTTTKIKNIKSYLTTALYNAPSTIDHYYTQRVRHDMGTEGFMRSSE